MHQDRKKTFAYLRLSTLLLWDLNWISISYLFRCDFCSWKICKSNKMNERNILIGFWCSNKSKLHLIDVWSLNECSQTIILFFKMLLNNRKKKLKEKYWFFASTMAWLSSIYIPIQRTAESFVMVPRSIRLFYPIAFLCPILRWEDRYRNYRFHWNLKIPL